MRIGVIGSGRIGGGAARLLARAGHDLLLSSRRDSSELQALAAAIGARTGTPAEAASHGEVVILSVPWAGMDDALALAGGPDALAGRVVLDTTDQFGALPDGRTGLLDLRPDSAARVNARKAPAAAWAKAFNTLTAGFQQDSAGRDGDDRVVMFYATDDAAAVPVVEQLVDDAGFAPVLTGTLVREDVGHQEPKGDLYGEEFRRDQAIELVARLRGTEPSGRGRP